MRGRTFVSNYKLPFAAVLLFSVIFSGCSSKESSLTANKSANTADYSQNKSYSPTATTNSNSMSAERKAEFPEGAGNGERYAEIKENPFLETSRAPLSTFSIDVDTASYSNLRRFLNQGSLPPKDAVRIEELINYFEYDYPQPEGNLPFSVNTEVAACPWNAKHKIVQIGLQGKKVSLDNVPPSNLVFLVDVSGSMNSPGQTAASEARSENARQSAFQQRSRGDCRLRGRERFGSAFDFS